MSMFPIASATVGAGGSTSITFSSIPATYTHLQLRVFGQSNANIGGFDQMAIRFSGDSAANYTQHQIEGNGATASSGSYTGGTYCYIGRLSDGAVSPFGVSIIDILDYANTNKNKTVKSLQGVDLNGSGRVALYSSLWINTSAVTSMVMIPQTAGTFQQNSRFDLYGITTSQATGA